MGKPLYPINGTGVPAIGEDGAPSALGPDLRVPVMGPDPLDAVVRGGAASLSALVAYLAAQPMPTNAQTGTAYTLALSDAGKEVTMTNASPNVVTIPADADVDFPVNTVINISQFGDGVTSITAAAGVDLNEVTAGSCDLLSKFVGGGSLKKRAANDWIVRGDIGTVS